MHFELRIDPTDILLHQQGDHFEGALTFVIGDFGASGPTSEPTVLNFNLNLKREQRDAVMKDGIPISQDHAVNDSVRKVRIIILDQGTNAVGSLILPAGASPGQ
jgi:hypothetical protein